MWAAVIVLSAILSQVSATDSGEGSVSTCASQQNCVAFFKVCATGSPTWTACMVAAEICEKSREEGGISSACAGGQKPPGQKAENFQPPERVCQTIDVGTKIAYFQVKDGTTDNCGTLEDPGNGAVACGPSTAYPDSQVCVPNTIVCTWLVLKPSCTAADPHFSGFDGTEYDVKGRDQLYYNLLTEKSNIINAKFAQVQPVEVEFLWMTEFGFVLHNTTVEVKIKFDNYVPKFNHSFQAHDRVDRMLFNNLHDILEVMIDGKPATDFLESKAIMKAAGDISVYFPDAKNVNDPTDGPVLVVSSPEIEVQVLFETEGVLHLDLGLHLKSSRITEMHGLLGQTLHWDANIGSNQLEGEEDDYIVPSLLDTTYKFSLFGNSGTKGKSLIAMDNRGFVPKFGGSGKGRLAAKMAG